MGEYEVRLQMRNAGLTVHQDLRFVVLVGSVCTVSGYEGRSRVGTPLIPAPTATFGGGIITLTSQVTQGTIRRIESSASLETGSLFSTTKLTTTYIVAVFLF